MTSKNATLGTLRELNARSVLGALVDNGRLSRAEVARRLGMAKPTANRAIEALAAAGLVRESSPPDSGPHYGAIYYEPALEVGHVLGIDVGAQFVRGALGDLGGAILARYDHPRGGDDIPSLLTAVSAVRNRLLAPMDAGADGIVGTVVAMAGVIDPAAGRLRLSSEPSLEGHPVVEDLATVLPGPLEVDNDVNLAALGELARGAGQNEGDFAFLSIGTGVGSGLVLDGRLRRGARGAAGEVDYPGHRPFATHSPAADALQQLVEDRYGAAAKNRAGSRDEAVPESPTQLFEAARAGWPLAVRVVREEAQRIAGTIAMIALVVDVPLVVLGGGIGLNGGIMLDPIRDRLTELVPYPPRVEISRLGDAATVVGAITVAAHEAWPRTITARLAATSPSSSNASAQGLVEN